jgi:hypothetical protein
LEEVIWYWAWGNRALGIGKDDFLSYCLALSHKKMKLITTDYLWVGL